MADSSVCKEQIMKGVNSLRSATANVLIGLCPAIIGPIAVAEGFADIMPKPAAVEVVKVDEAAMRIDIVASLRAISASLKEARVIDVGAAPKEDVQVAVVERRDRG
jgi:hypothetical protein